MNNFYGLSSKLMSSTLQVKKGRYKNGMEIDMGIYHGKTIEGKLPVVYDYHSGSKYTDLIDIGYPSCYLISDRFKAVLIDNNISGYKIFPVEIYKNRGKDQIQGYNGLSIVGRCGPIDYMHGKVIDKQMCPTCPVFQVYKGLHFDINTWDGSDFFSMGRGGIFVTEKLMHLVMSEKLTNVKFTNIIDMEGDLSILKSANIPFRP